MKANGLLKWLLIPALLLAVWVGVNFSSRPHTPSPPQGATVRPLTAAEMADLGIAADSPRDTVATLVAQVQHLKGKLATSLRDTHAQRSANRALRAQLKQIDIQLQAALHSQAAHWQHEKENAARSANEAIETESHLNDLQQKVDALTGEGNAENLPVGLGLRPGDGGKFTRSGRSENRDVRWVNPLGPPASPKGSPPTSDATANPFRIEGGFGTDNPGSPGFGVNSSDAGQKQTAHIAKVTARTSIAVYTLPANATLIGSVAMTALIGRIPVNGTVEDPYPFKVLLGRQNLTANGIDLPNVAGAVMSGTATGDWTLSCVRGHITSVTFVFRDGTIRTIGASQTGNGASGQRELGWISDPYGIPCVSGVRRSNAEQYLGSQMLITAAGAGAASLIRNQNANYSYVAGSNGSTLGTVGISGNEAMGRILAGGVEAMSQWVNKLYGQAFAAIYVPPGARVAVHIVRPIDIDYDPHGRRVHYEGATRDASHLD